MRRNPTIGYCQGFNYLVAHLLRYMEEEEAFWMICAIVEIFLPLDYYSCMIGVLVDQKIFGKLLKETLPDIWNTFKKCKTIPDLITTKWFVCLFSHYSEPEVADKIWDHLFLRGTKMVFKAGLASLALIEKNIIRCKNIGNYINNNRTD